MARRRFDESKVHRQPRGAPAGRGGEFAERPGWARQVSDRIALPSARTLLERTPPNTDLPDVARELEGRYGRGGGLIVQNVGVYKMGGDRPDAPFDPYGHLVISGELASDDDPDNLQEGYFRVTVMQTRETNVDDPLKWVADIDRMHVRGTAQGGGGGRELTDRLVEWFRRSGVDEVTVGPSEIGSYAWGAMGFDFHDHESRRIAWQGAMDLTVESVRNWLGDTGRSYGLDGSDLTDAQIRRMISQYRRAATLALAGGMSYKRLSQYGRRKGQGKNDWWAGKLGLLVGGVGGGRIKL